MFDKLFSAFLGEAPKGQRKFIMGMTTITGLMAINAYAVLAVSLKWGDAATLGVMLEAVTDALWLVFGAAALGLTGEHFAGKRHE